MASDDLLKHYLSQLIQFESLTPNDQGCQDYLRQWFVERGFTCQTFPCGKVSNLYAQLGQSGPFMLFAGHTDVVPPGPNDAWQSPPFVLTSREGRLFGRGVADMKGAIAAMMGLAELLQPRLQQHSGRIGFLFTSGEEGDDYLHGTPWAMKHLLQQGLRPDYCIVGEPTSQHRVGDTIKIGRRGSLHAHLNFEGRQGHVAYPHLAQNPIHQALHALADLASYPLDEGNAFFPPSSLQLTNLHAGQGSNNVIPPNLTCSLNIRFSTEHTMHSLQQHILSCLQRHEVSPDIRWELSGDPFLTSSGRLLQVTQDVIFDQLGERVECSTSGGTSDARFIAPLGIEVIELGLTHQSIHQINESIAEQELMDLLSLYQSITQRLLTLA
jgi:succinyl-diaminopimelate desuccinylase